MLNHRPLLVTSTMITLSNCKLSSQIRRSFLQTGSMTTSSKNIINPMSVFIISSHVPHTSRLHLSPCPPPRIGAMSST
jgi:hypothetical protein